MAGRNYSEAGEDKTFSYDLRQRRAKMIADCIEDVVEACKLENYYTWYKNIEDLYTIARHAFSDKENVNGEYNKKKKEVIDVANKYPQSWFGKDKNTVACQEIEQKLRAQFEFVMEKIEDSGLLGTRWDDDDGL